MPPYPLHHERKDHTGWFSYAGLYLLLALTLGGGTRSALMSDAILFLLGLPLVWNFFKTFPNQSNRLVTGLIIAVFALFLWQLVPWYESQGLYFPNTVDVWRTLQAFIMFLVIISLFWRLAHENENGRWLATKWLFVGMALNLLFSLLVFSGNNRVFEPFGWRMHAGFFANENHLSLLYVICTPMIVAWFSKSKWPWLSFPVILGLVAVNFVVGSRAGVSLILLAAVLSYVYVIGNSRVLFILMFLLITVGGWWSIVHLGWSQDLVLEGDKINRPVFWANTWKAILDHWPWGSGFGTFVPVYAGYEQPFEIRSVYVNSAHNDWLELMLEGGMPAIIMAGLLFIALIVIFSSGNMHTEQRAALLAIFFVMLHSIVDYPMRTMAIAVSGALMLAWIFRSEQPWSPHNFMLSGLDKGERASLL